MISFGFSYYVFMERNNEKVLYVIQTEKGITEPAPENIMTDKMRNMAYLSSIICIISGLGSIIILAKSTLKQDKKNET